MNHARTIATELIAPPHFWSGGSHAERRVTWLELFFDLVFVAAVAQVGSQLAADLSPVALARYGFLFLLIWWAWNGYAVYATRFDTDDGVQRVLTMLQMLAVALMAANAEEGLASESSAGFAAAYAVMRLLLVLQYLRALAIDRARSLARDHAIGFGLAAVVWLASAFIPAPARYVAWGLALGLDLGTGLVTSRHTERLPPDAAHLPERFGLFTLILLGESMIAVMKGMQGQRDWSLAAASAAFLGMGLIFGYWWWYFHGAGAAAPRHIRSRRDARRFAIWNALHLPLYVALAATGISIEHIVSSGAAAQLHLPEAIVFGGATAAAMAVLTTIAAVSTKEGPGSPDRRGIVSGYALASLPLAAIPLAPLVPAAVIVSLFAGLCLLQTRVVFVST